MLLPSIFALWHSETLPLVDTLATGVCYRPILHRLNLLVLFDYLFNR